MKKIDQAELNQLPCPPKLALQTGKHVQILKSCNKKLSSETRPRPTLLSPKIGTLKCKRKKPKGKKQTNKKHNEDFSQEIVKRQAISPTGTEKNALLNSKSLARRNPRLFSAKPYRRNDQLKASHHATNSKLSMLGMNNTIDYFHMIKEVNSNESTQAELYQTSKPAKRHLQRPNLTKHSTLSSKGSSTMRKSDLHSALKSPALNQPLHESKNSFDFKAHKTIDTSKARISS
ncbi:unnamed protein product [Moneuplotes crassus]|uniref:Uncharacterized protein n=1 Tax=Euplotes crassus TaxID=5936 RepID=A0AAD1Y7P2_EUPCR|nr:unnamed protein product [Moneuplotes crassus]